jgi:hypothetical protein
VRYPFVLLVAWLAASGMLVATAYHDALLVFRYGMGAVAGG